MKAVNLTARIRQLEARRIELLALLERTVARLDALEGVTRDIVALLCRERLVEELWLCPCGFLASVGAGLCAACDGDGAGTLEENVDLTGIAATPSADSR